MGLHPQLAAITSQFDAMQARLHRLAAATADDRWAQRADPARWSIAECVAHLNLTGRAYVPLIEGALDEARRLGGPAPPRYRQDPAGWLLGKMVGPLPRLGRLRLGRVKTPAAFVPEGDQPREQVMAEFDALQARQVAFVREANGLPIDAVKLVSAFDARVRYNLYACLVMLPRHQLRHVLQAEQVWGSAPR